MVEGTLPSRVHGGFAYLREGQHRQGGHVPGRGLRRHPVDCDVWRTLFLSSDFHDFIDRLQYGPCLAARAFRPSATTFTVIPQSGQIGRSVDENRRRHEHTEGCLRRVHSEVLHPFADGGRDVRHHVRAELEDRPDRPGNDSVSLLQPVSPLPQDQGFGQNAAQTGRQGGLPHERSALSDSVGAGFCPRRIRRGTIQCRDGEDVAGKRPHRPFGGRRDPLV